MMGKRAKSASLLFNELFKDPILNVKRVEEITGLSP